MKWRKKKTTNETTTRKRENNPGNHTIDSDWSYTDQCIQLFLCGVVKSEWSTVNFTLEVCIAVLCRCECRIGSMYVVGFFISFEKNKLWASNANDISLSFRFVLTKQMSMHGPINAHLFEMRSTDWNYSLENKRITTELLTFSTRFIEPILEPKRKKPHRSPLILQTKKRTYV